MRTKILQIGIEASCLLNSLHTGIAIYAKNLLVSISQLPDCNKNFTIEVLYKASNLKRMIHSTQLSLPSQLKKRWYLKQPLLLPKNYPVIHCTDTTFIKKKRPKKITTVHDLSLFKKEHDMPFFSSKKFIAAYTEKLQTIVKHSDEIITYSHSTKKDFLEHFTFPEKKVHVIYLGVNYTPPSSLQNHQKILYDFGLHSKRYFLFVGAVSVRKNLVNLIRAYNNSPLSNEFDLAIVGPMSTGNSIIKFEIYSLRLQNRVRILDYVSDSVLSILYSHSAALLFPTYYEGFGIPILEAMMHKIPVLIGNRGASVEIAKEHATAVDPFSIDAITEGISKTMTMGDSQIQAAQRHAEQFTWNQCAERTVNVYRTITGM